jgi:hypothetical protein
MRYVQPFVRLFDELLHQHCNLPKNLFPARDGLMNMKSGKADGDAYLKRASFSVSN